MKLKRHFPQRSFLRGCVCVPLNQLENVGEVGMAIEIKMFP